MGAIELFRIRIRIEDCQAGVRRDHESSVAALQKGHFTTETWMIDSCPLRIRLLTAENAESIEH